MESSGFSICSIKGKPGVVKIARKRDEMKELTSFSHGYGQLMGHIVLVPYRRKKIFKRDDIKFCAENILMAISKKYKFEIIEMQVMEDHVHIFLSMKPTQSISTVVQCLKGISRFPIQIFLSCHLIISLFCFLFINRIRKRVNRIRVNPVNPVKSHDFV